MLATPLVGLLAHAQAQNLGQEASMGMCVLGTAMVSGCSCLLWYAISHAACKQGMQLGHCGNRAPHGLTTILCLPVAPPCLDQLQDASCFSCLDLQQAYHQVRLCRGDVHGPPTLGRHHLTCLTPRLTHLRML